MEKLLVPLDVYLKSGIHIGSRFRTKYMLPFVYKIRADGLSIINVQDVDKRIKLAINFISRYKPEEILVVCRRRKGRKAAELFSKLIGCKSYIGRYLPGSMTNIHYEKYMEPKLVITVDPWQDRNAIKDAKKVGAVVLSLADTNNVYSNVDLVIPGNNKSKKSIGLVFYLLAKGYLEKTKQLTPELEKELKLEDFQE